MPIDQQIQNVLNDTHPEAYMPGSSLGLPSVGFLLERETVTTNYASGTKIGTSRSLVALGADPDALFQPAPSQKFHHSLLFSQA